MSLRFVVWKRVKASFSVRLCSAKPTYMYIAEVHSLQNRTFFSSYTTGSLVTTRPIPYLHRTSSVLRKSPLEIYHSKFAKDHFFLVKYFCILRKLHKYFCVS